MSPFRMNSGRVSLIGYPLLCISVMWAVLGCANPAPQPSVSGSPSQAAESSAAPSSSAPVAGQTATPDSGLASGASACELTTPDDVVGVLGGPAPVSESLPAGGWVATQCAWKSPTTGFVVSIGTSESIEKFGDPNAPDADARLADYTKRLGPAGKEVVDLGDSAVIGPTGVAVSVGGTYLEILRLGLTDDQLVAVARLIVGKL